MHFTKMHGIGNDYVYINTFRESVPNPEKLAITIADRHFGVGGDGLILVAPPTAEAAAKGAQVRMRMFNADGSESEMCGNGVRCVAKFAFDHNLSTANPMLVETGRGILSIQLHIQNNKVQTATVNMGQPILEPEQIPILPHFLAKTRHDHEYQIPFDVSAGAPAHGIPATFVSMGNPHAVIFTDDVQKIDLEKIGPMLEKHRAFPRRINVHFVQVHSPRELTMRTWERGSGITLACGTGASAVCVAASLMNKADREVLIHLPGGDLQLCWSPADDAVYMTGPATEVFTGEWPE